MPSRSFGRPGCPWLSVQTTLLGLCIAGCSSHAVGISSSSDTPLKVGSIFIRGLVSVSFSEVARPLPPSSPEFPLLELDGAASQCTVMRSTMTDPSNVLSTAVSAGTITIARDGEPVAIMPQIRMLDDGGASLSYAPVALDPGISPGDALTITASGATVPAFSVDVTIPAAITVTHPDPTSAPPFVIVRSTDLPIAWTGGGSRDTVLIGLDQTVGATTTAITCSSAAATGGIAIPAMALSYLSATSADDAGPVPTSALVVFPSLLKLFSVQDWALSVTAEPATSFGVEVTVE